ncbi:hypothetical protein [Halomonas sp. E14]|uniref:hypothetical protein n=1 Tax=Halomonas sp. E14 TaxID=3397245 RepID=UPI00403E58BA
MHRHVEWDDPGSDSVMRHFEQQPGSASPPGRGDILSARYQGKVVRVRVEAYVNDTSIGDVVAIIEPDSGTRRRQLGKLCLGDTVRLPDDRRAFEPRGKERPDEPEEAR